MADKAQPEISAGTAVSGNAARAFISYASQDKVVADAVCQALEHAGVTCWIAPRDVVLGGSYAGEIVHAIDGTKLLILILSKNSADSKHVLREVERASSKGHSVVGFKIDMAPISADLEYFLNTSQWLDASDTGVERALPRLIDAVKRVISSLSTAGNFQGSTASASQRAPVSKVGNRRLRFLALALGALVALGSVYFAVDKLWFSKRSAPEQPATAATTGVSEKSIAVLPFTDISEKKDQAYFADGIAEEVLNRLAKVPGLKVVGRASSFHFRGKDVDPASVGVTLGVAYLLEGSVRKEAERVRVTAQLVEARTGSQRWSDRFDSDVIDVLNVQDSIAAKIARALQLAVEVDTASRPSVKSPQTLEAYLRGLQSLNRFSQEGAESAVADFQQALNLEPTFAPAAAGLAQTYAFIGAAGWSPPRVAFEHAREAASLAQRLDPKSPLPHVSLAEIHVHYDWDWVGADRELQQAFALGPPEAYGLQTASALAAALGHWDEARQLAIQAIELDPLGAAVHGVPGFEIYLRSDRVAEAEKSFRRALQIAPGWGSGQYFLGVALMLQGHYEAALAEFRKETLDDGQLEGSAMVFFATGRRAESDTRLAEAIRHNGSSWPSEIARVYSFRGEKDKAFEWLDRAYEMRDEDLYFIKDDPLFKNLMADPRYKAFFRRMNLPE
jgi:TolB-like protein